MKTVKACEALSKQEREREKFINGTIVCEEKCLKCVNLYILLYKLCVWQNVGIVQY